MTKGWSKKGERDAEGDRDETNEAAHNLLGGILGEAHQVLSETRHELVGGALQELELRGRLEHVEQCFPGTLQDTGGGSYLGGQLLYEDRYEHEKRQDPQPDQGHEGDQYREPPRHHTQKPPHREGEGHRQREAAEEGDGDGRRRPHQQHQRDEPERERDGSGPPRDPDGRGPEAPSRKTRHASVSTFHRRRPAGNARDQRSIRPQYRCRGTGKFRIWRQSVSLARQGRRAFQDVEGEPLILGVGNHFVARIEGTTKNHAGELVVHSALYGAPQWACAELRVEALLGDQLDRSFGELDLDALGSETPIGAVEEEPSYVGYLLPGERVEDDDLVYPVDELRAQLVPHDQHHVHSELLEGLVAAGVGLDPLRAHVRGHDDDRVLEVHGAALRVGEPSVVQDLQEYVEDVRVSFLYLVQQQDRVRTAPDLLCELAGLLVADVARWSPNEPRDGVPLLELAHVNAHHRRLVPEEGLGERPRELGLSYACRTEEQEAAYRAVRIREPRPRAADSLGDRLDSLLLADDPLMQLLLEAHEPLTLLLR